MTQVEDTIYLGSNVNQNGNTNKEIARRTKDCIVTWKRLGILWKQAACTVRES